jgi:membrane protease YdiL (CAAX protease family)
VIRLGFIHQIIALFPFAIVSAVGAAFVMRAYSKRPPRFDREPARWTIVEVVLVAVVYLTVAIAVDAVSRGFIDRDSDAGSDSVDVDPSSGALGSEKESNVPSTEPAEDTDQVEIPQSAVGLGLTVLVPAIAGSGAILTIAFFAFRHSARGLGWVGLDARGVGLLAFLLILVYAPLSLTAALWQFFLDLVHGSTLPEQDAVRMFRDATLDRDWPRLAVLILGPVVVAPISEELFFRGFLQSWLRAKSSALPAMVLSSMFFALVHPMVVWLPIFGVGLLLGWIYERSGRLLEAVAYHAMFNSAQLAILVSLG